MICQATDHVMQSFHNIQKQKIKQQTAAYNLFFNAIFWHHHHYHHHHHCHQHHSTRLATWMLLFSESIMPCAHCARTYAQLHLSNTAHSPVIKPNSIEHIHILLCSEAKASLSLFISLFLSIFLNLLCVVRCAIVRDWQCINTIKHPLSIFKSCVILIQFCEYKHIAWMAYEMSKRTKSLWNALQKVKLPVLNLCLVCKTEAILD